MQRAFESYPSFILQFFQVFSFIAGGMDLLFLIGITFFLGRRPKFFYYMFTYVFTDGSKNLLKLYYHYPRPYFTNPDILSLDCSFSFGNPSGHATTSTVFVLVLFLDIFHGNEDSLFEAYKMSQPQLRPMEIQVKIYSYCVYISCFIGGILWIGLVCFSRFLLGSHSLDQIVYGIMLGTWISLFLHIMLRDIVIRHIGNVIKIQRSYIQASNRLLSLMSNSGFGQIDLNTPENNKKYLGNEINEDLNSSEGSIEESGELDNQRHTLKDDTVGKKSRTSVLKNSHLSNAQQMNQLMQLDTISAQNSNGNAHDSFSPRKSEHYKPLLATIISTLCYALFYFISVVLFIRDQKHFDSEGKDDMAKWVLNYNQNLANCNNIGTHSMVNHTFIDTGTIAFGYGAYIFTLYRRRILLQSSNPIQDYYTWQTTKLKKELLVKFLIRLVSVIPAMCLMIPGYAIDEGDFGYGILPF